MKQLLTCLLLILLLAACGNSDQDPISTEIVDSVRAFYAEAQAQDANVPGIVVGVWDQQRGLTLTYAVGEADIATGEQMTTEHSFKVASITKTMVTTVIGQLIDEGLLGFETPLSTFFSDLPEAENITIEMLSNMTSGYFDYLENEVFLNNFDNVPYFQATPEEMVQVAMSHPLEYPPGTGYNYSNTNTVLLGMIIEQLTGNPLATELNNRLFEPLGMTHSGAPADGSYLPEPAAHSYHPNTREDWTDKMDYSPEYACGNAYSTLADLKLWIEALASGALVSSETQQRRLAAGSSIPGAEDYIYHFGMIDYRGLLGHSGDTDYYLSEAYSDPANGRTIIVLSNTSATGFTGALFREIAGIVLDQ